MKKILLALFLVFLLTGCDKTVKCTDGKDTVVFKYNDEEFISMQRDGEDVGAIEFAAYEKTFDLMGREEFEEDLFILYEELGYTCR